MTRSTRPDFAAGHENREFARVRIEFSASHGGVMQIQRQGAWIEHA
jgi:hypothetical protein